MSSRQERSPVRDLARPEILALEPYASARALAAEPSGQVRLDANESPWDAFGAAPGSGLNRYPEPQPPRLRGLLARYYGVPEDHLLVTRGADESIDVLLRIFCRPGQDAVVTCPPTFGFYRVAAGVQGAGVREVPLGDGFVLDAEAVVAACGEPNASVKLVFLCSPNNPTGNAVPPGEIEALARALPRQIVVVDEAYVEFSEAGSVAAQAGELPNLVVLRTLSKAFALAGARVGALVAGPEVVSLAGRVLAPYPIPAPSAAAAERALGASGLDAMRERVARTRRLREDLARELLRCPDVRRVLPSEGNFLLAEAADAEALALRLRREGILVRRFGSVLEDHLRITVGSPEDHALLLRALGVEVPPPEPEREATVTRTTRETDISVSVRLDAPAPVAIATGIGFYDHMLEQVARHGGFGLSVACRGDLEVDGHHTIEDVALALGEALRRALGDKRGIERYGFVLPMDEARAEVLLDLSGRPACRFRGSFPDTRVGGMPTEMVPHVFESLAESLGAAIHVSVDGDNTHHMVESCFKALGRALRQAVRRTGGGVPSTKGVL